MAKLCINDGGTVKKITLKSGKGGFTIVSSDGKIWHMDKIPYYEHSGGHLNYEDGYGNKYNFFIKQSYYKNVWYTSTEANLNFSVNNKTVEERIYSPFGDFPYRDNSAFIEIYGSNQGTVYINMTQGHGYELFGTGFYDSKEGTTASYSASYSGKYLTIKGTWITSSHDFHDGIPQRVSITGAISQQIDYLDFN